MPYVFFAVKMLLSMLVDFFACLNSMSAIIIVNINVKAHIYMLHSRLQARSTRVRVPCKHYRVAHKNCTITVFVVYFQNVFPKNEMYLLIYELSSQLRHNSVILLTTNYDYAIYADEDSLHQSSS